MAFFPEIILIRSRDKIIMLFSVFRNTATRLLRSRSNVLIARRSSGIIPTRRPQQETLKTIVFLSASKKPQTFSWTLLSASNSIPSMNMRMLSPRARRKPRVPNSTVYGARFFKQKDDSPKYNQFPSSARRTAAKTTSTLSTTSSTTSIHGVHLNIKMRMFLMTMKVVIRSDTQSERTTMPARRRRPRILPVSVS